MFNVGFFYDFLLVFWLCVWPISMRCVHVCLPVACPNVECTVGPLLAGVPSGLSLIPPHEKKSIRCNGENLTA
jgi:hypothetical protein